MIKPKAQHFHLLPFLALYFARHAIYSGHILLQVGLVHTATP